MFPELVVSASFVMLSAAQHFQMDPYQLGQLSNSQSAQSSLPPNSQLFLIQRANTILSQDIGTPLQPGLLSGPIYVSDTAQNMLDQESKVVGYNMPFGLHQVVQQHNQAHQQSLSNLPATQFVSVNTPNQMFIPNTPHLIPVTSADAVIRNQGSKISYGKSHGSPQSLSFPVLSNGNSRNPANVIPVRAMASIKNYFAPEKQRKDVPYFNFKNSPMLLHSNRRPHQHAKTFFNPVQKPNSIRFSPHANLYDDIPPNHPVPPPRPSQSQPQPQQDSRREINPQSKTVYYDIPLNHPVPAPPGQSERNLYEQLAQQLRQGDNNQFQPPSSIPTHDVRGEYTPARPPPEVTYQQAPSQIRPPPEATHHQAQSQIREEEIINLMPPLPYRDEFGQEQQGHIEVPSSSINHPEQETIQRPDVSLSPPINDFVPPIAPAESSKSIHKKPLEDISSEQDVATTYRPNSANEDDDEAFAKPKKSSKGKSKSRSESPKGTRNHDTETSHSENFYQQAPTYANEGYSGGNTGYSYNDGGYASPQKEVIHKHIFVHAAPDSYQSHAPRVRVVRPAVAPEKHVNIIFVKSPTPPPEPQTVVELPAMHQPKTFVYVLSKHPKEEHGNIKLISPPKSKPHPPEIFFIRYGAKDADNKGYPVPNLQSLYDNYGTLSNPQPQIARPPSAPSSPGLAPGLIPPPPRGPPFRRGLMFRQKRHKDYGLDVYAPLMAYANTGQINEITREEADSRRTKLEDFF